MVTQILPSHSTVKNDLGLYGKLIQALESQSLDANSANETIKRIADLLIVGSPSSDQRLDAAFAYYVAGYYARALNISPTSEIPRDAPRIQNWLSLFLAKKLEDLNSSVEIILQNRDFSDVAIRDDIAAYRLMNKVPPGKTLEYEVVERVLSVKVAECISRFLEFAKTGNQNNLTEAFSGLSKCEKLAIKSRELQWWWWLVCLRFVMKEFEENSLWTCLESMRTESELVTKYIQSNYKHRNPVVELWRSQIESIGSVNDPERRSFCLRMPTGAGKTRVAELMILRFLVDNERDTTLKCVYIAPFRTLASEVEDGLSQSFDLIKDAKVSQFYGSYEIDPLDQADIDQTRVLVITPEKLDGMLRQRPELIKQIRLIVVDEGHLVGERSPRGSRYQMLLHRLIYALKIKRSYAERNGTRLLFISGVLPNANEFARWITGNDGNVIDSPWRPIDEPRFGDLIWDGQKLIRSDTNLEILLPTVSVSPQSQFSENATDSEQKLFVQVAAQVAVQFAKISRTMLFSAKKSRIKSEGLLTSIEEIVKKEKLSNDDPLPEHLKKYSGPESRLLRYGVAVHHGDLPTPLRKEMEKRIYDGRVRLVLASPTLAQGVNLPIQKVIVYDLDHGQGERISDSMFWNVVGRIGRPLPSFASGTMAQQPEIWFLLDKSQGHITKDEKYRAELLQSKDNFRVGNAFLDFLLRIKHIWCEKRSSMTIATLVTCLAENDLSWIGDDTQRKEIQSFLSLIDSHLNDLSRESHFASSPVEDCLQEVTEELIGLLQGVDQLNDADLDYIKKAVTARASFLSKTIPEKKRERDYLLGLPENDRIQIESHQDELMDWYQSAYRIFDGTFEEGLGYLANIMDFLSGLSIVSDESKSSDLPISENTPTLFDLSQVPKSDYRHKMFMAWIRGDSETDVARYLRDINFERYREGKLERALPWGMSALGRFLNNLAQERNIQLPRILEYLPSLIKYGVPSPMACHLARMRFSRSASKKISDSLLEVSKSANISGLSGLNADDLLWTRENTIAFLQSLTKGEIAALVLEPEDYNNLIRARREKLD